MGLFMVIVVIYSPCYSDTFAINCEQRAFKHVFNSRLLAVTLAEVSLS